MIVREHWKFLMAATPQGYGPEVDGKPCYWFRLNHVGTGGTTLIIPRERYWSAPERRVISTEGTP